MDPQLHFDHLVETAEAWLKSSGFSAEERALEEKLEMARRRDAGVADAAVAVAWSRVAPKGLKWNDRAVAT